MAKRKSVVPNDAPEMGNFENGEVNLDLIQAENLVEIPKREPEYEEHPYVRGQREVMEKNIKNCLRNERVIVRRLPKKTGMVSDSNHIMGDGMHNNAYRMFSVPKLQRSNNFVNVLTNEEKDCLETTMGLKLKI